MNPARIALVVASNEYDDPVFGRLRAPVEDTEALAGVLGHPAIGGFRVQTLVNRPWSVVREEVEGFFAEGRREDLLLLCFSCHGVKDPSGQLYFVTTDSKFRRLAATGISSSFVNERMGQSRSRRIVLLLDCCYSGAFVRGLVPRAGEAVDVTERFEGRGRVVITASSSMEYAFERDELASGNPAASVFTSALVRGLRTGEADRDGDGQVSVDELYDYLFEEVRKATPSQTPSMFASVQGALYLARNPRQGRLPATTSGREEEAAHAGVAVGAGPVGPLITHGGLPLRAVAFSPDGARLATAGDDGTARVWEVAGGGELVRCRHDPLDWVLAVAYGPDGSRLATGSLLGTARVWQLPAGREIRQVRCDDSVRAVAFSPDGGRLATAGDDGTARVWQVATGREVVRVGHARAVHAVALAAGGRFMATAGDDGTARVWQIATGRELVRFAHEAPVGGVTFSPGGRFLATACADGMARVWPLEALEAPPLGPW